MGEADKWEKRLFIVAQQKPKLENFRTRADLDKLNYGMLTSEEHSHILRFINRDIGEGHPNSFLISFVDTYGADISMESAREFQAFFIARLIKAFINLPIPSISIILGEGGSGGALAIQYTDRRAQLDDAIYATAPPESMAAIIFRDPKRIGDALDILKPTAPELKSLGIIDHIIQSPHEVNDVEGFADPIKAYLEKTVKELSKVKCSKLLEERMTRAESFSGLTKQKPNVFRQLFSKTPLKKKTEKQPPPDIKTFVPDDSALQVRFDYREGHFLDVPPEQHIRCGETNKKGGSEEGCGHVLSLKEYQANFHVCPNCGRSRVMGALGWINCLSDQDTFHELYRTLSAKELLPASLMTREYRKFLAQQGRRAHFRESLVTGEAQVYGRPAVLAICEFYFSGGTMGVAFGEKFHRAVDYAIARRLPVVSLCCSGGARLWEGTLALMQMVKTVAAVERLKKHGLPFISILGDPSTGGAIASYAGLGDVIIAEPEAMVIFSGPRVMKSRGFPVDEDSIRASALNQRSSHIFDHLSYYQDIRGIHEVAPRKDMKRVVSKYLEYCRIHKGK